MHETLHGSASLRTHDEEDGITFKVGHHGQVVVSVMLIHYLGPVHRLELGFESDQTCIPDFVEGLVRAAESVGCQAS